MREKYSIIKKYSLYKIIVAYMSSHLCIYLCSLNMLSHWAFTFSAWGDDESDAAPDAGKILSRWFFDHMKFVLDMEIFCFISMRWHFFRLIFLFVSLTVTDRWKASDWGPFKVPLKPLWDTRMHQILRPIINKKDPNLIFHLHQFVRNFIDL